MPPLRPVLWEMNPVDEIPRCLFNIHSNIVLASDPTYFKLWVMFSFFDYNFVRISCSSHTYCFSRRSHSLILLTFCEEYKSSTSLCVIISTPCRSTKCPLPLFLIHPAPDVCRSCVLENVGVNKKGVNQKWYSHQIYGLSVIEHSQAKGVKSRMRGRKLRSDVNWPGVLKKKGVKIKGRKVRTECTCECN